MLPITRKARPKVQVAATTIRNFDRRSLKVMSDIIYPLFAQLSRSYSKDIPAEIRIHQISAGRICNSQSEAHNGLT